MASVEFVYSLALNTFFRPVNVPVFLVFFQRVKKEITSLIWFRNCFESWGKTHAHFLLVFSRTITILIGKTWNLLIESTSRCPKKSLIRIPKYWDTQRMTAIGSVLRFYNYFAQSTTLLIVMSSTEMNSRTFHGWNPNGPHNISCFNHWLLSPSLSLIAFDSFICS